MNCSLLWETLYEYDINAVIAPRSMLGVAKVDDPRNFKAEIDEKVL